jgi:hypothetical protein
MELQHQRNERLWPAKSVYWGKIFEILLGHNKDVMELDSGESGEKKAIQWFMEAALLSKYAGTDDEVASLKSQRDDPAILHYRKKVERMMLDDMRETNQREFFSKVREVITNLEGLRDRDAILHYREQIKLLVAEYDSIGLI